MWRNLGWAAVLATWTIFLILNSGLAGEQTSGNPQTDNGHNSHETYQRTTFPAFHKKAIGKSVLQYAREIFASSDHSSVNTKAISMELKNTETRDFKGIEKRIATSDAITTPVYSTSIGSGGGGGGDDNRNAWPAAKRIATGNMWLSKIIILEKLRNARYRKFAANPHVSPSNSRVLKVAPRRRKRKERTTYVFSSGRKKVMAIRHDIRALDQKDEQRKNERILNEENEPSAFFHEELTKRPHDKQSGSTRLFENSNTSKFGNLRGREFKHGDTKLERNKNGDCRRSLELIKNGANKLIYVEANDRPRTSEVTLPSSEENRADVGTVTGITGNTITENSLYERTAAATWTTLIFNSKLPDASGDVSNGENVISSYHFSKDEPVGPHKVDEFLAAEVYRHRKGEHSKIGFNVNTYARREEGDIAVALRAPNSSPDKYLARNMISFAERLPPRIKEGALRATRDTIASRHEYHSLIYNVSIRADKRMSAASLDESRKGRKTQRKKKEITADANYTAMSRLFGSDPLSIKSSAGGIDESKLEPPMSARISVTQYRNPMHVEHVKSSTDCERQRTSDVEAEVRAAEVGLRNVSDLPRTAKFEDPLEQKARSPSEYSRKSGTSDIGRREVSTENKSVFHDATIKNVRVARRIGNYGGARKESDIDSRVGGNRNSKYRRYKRHEVRNTSESPILTESGSETERTVDTITVTTSNMSMKLTANPSILVTETDNLSGVLASASEPAVTTAASLSSRYRETRKESRSSVPISGDYERYTNAPAKVAPDSLEIPLIDARESLNVSALGTPALPIETFDRSTAVTKIDNSVIPKEAPTAVEVTARVPAVTDRYVSDAPSIEPINSQKGHGALANGSVTTIDPPLPQRNSDLVIRDVLENITTENVDNSSADSTFLNQWPVKHSAVVEGDLVLGGLMMVHEREDTITCGPVMPQGGIQPLEAMLYTLDTLNNREIVPGVKIGAHILDDCDKDTYGLEMAVDFIKGTCATEKPDDYARPLHPVWSEFH